MTDAELRALVRETVARHLAAPGRRSTPPQPTLAPVTQLRTQPGDDLARHPSHYLYLTVVNATEACVIEPAVACDHCGYCRSHGH